MLLTQVIVECILFKVIVGVAPNGAITMSNYIRRFNNNNNNNIFYLYTVSFKANIAYVAV